MNSFHSKQTLQEDIFKIGKFVHFTVHSCLGSQNSNTANLNLPFTVDSNTNIK